MVRKSDCVELEMSVDAALKYIVSMGWWLPGGPRPVTSQVIFFHSLRRQRRRKFCHGHALSYCGLVTEALMGQTVTLSGWVNRRRDHGGVIFIDLRDREGYVQVVCDPDRAEMFKTAEGVRNEFCVQVKGLVRARPEGTTNDKPQERQIEVLCHELNVLNPRSRPVPDGRRQPVRKPRA